jgi:hypothetical protein
MPAKGTAEALNSVKERRSNGALRSRLSTNGSQLSTTRSLFIHYFDLLIDYLPGKPIDSHMDPVMLFPRRIEFFDVGSPGAFFCF